MSIETLENTFNLKQIQEDLVESIVLCLYQDTWSESEHNFVLKYEQMCNVTFDNITYSNSLLMRIGCSLKVFKRYCVHNREADLN